MSFKRRRRLNPQSRENRSALHLKTRDLLRSAYGGFRILEEEPIPARVDGRITELSIDFVLPDIKLAVEVHGRQHDEYVPHYHRGPEGFAASQARDRAKANAIRDAGYALVVLREKDLKDMTRLDLMTRVQNALKELREWASHHSTI